MKDLKVGDKLLCIKDFSYLYMFFKKGEVYEFLGVQFNHALIKTNNGNAWIMVNLLNKIFTLKNNKER